MRRDVLRLGQRYKEKHAEWSAEWIERIAKLYDLNDKRLLALADEDAFFAAHAELQLFLLDMEQVRDAELADEPREEKAKVLRSMVNHWDGLTLFLDFPAVPLDNSEAERRIRSPAVGRKNYYGSGSVWSGQLAAMMFSILQTLELQGLCPRKWMTRYLTACAEQRGKVPEDLERFLPWNLKEEDRAHLLPGTPRDTA
jgi:transposase